eukprot:s3089_g4.t1
MRPPCRRAQPRVGALCLLCLLLGAALPASVPPLWWQKGRPRKKMGSRAEAELLCQLATLLMPDVPIAEAFRDFPVEKSEAWGSSRLSPDLTAYGVLKTTDAALFIEYDGLDPTLVLRLEAFAAEEGCNKDASTCAKEAELVGMSDSRRTNLEEFVCKEVCVNTWQIAKVIAKFPRVLGYSIEANLKPAVEWIKGLGLSQSQVAKVIATFPQVPGLSIEANLKPTVEWIKGLSLSQSQVAKLIAKFPPVLSTSIEANLKPTVEWIKGLGLSQSQVAKVIAACPSVHCLSIDANLSVKHLLLQQYFPGVQAAKLLAQAPRLWSYRYARLEHRLAVLKAQGQLSKLAGAMTPPLDAFTRRYCGCMIKDAC